jgi:orotate phosphoribosyltransferase
MAMSASAKLGTKTRADRILELASATGAMLYGQFTLASGKQSDHYYDGKRMTFHPEGSYLIGRGILERLKGTGVEGVGGLAMGAVSIATAVALVGYCEKYPIPAFIVREEVKTHGTARKIEGHFTPGKKVAIVDDVITTGGSILKAVEAAEAGGCKVVKIIAIVDRKEGGSDRLKEKGYDFEAIIDWPPSKEATVNEFPTVSS